MTIHILCLVFLPFFARLVGCFVGAFFPVIQESLGRGSLASKESQNTKVVYGRPPQI
jgi:hypothetical protein